MEEKQLTDWDSGLYDCFEDASSCCYGCWCSPCFACSVSGQFGENPCLPLCDVFSAAVTIICHVPLFAPPAALSLRSAIRHKYSIQGSLCKDIAVSCCCPCCSWCQMYREIKHRKQTPVIVNLQSQAVINVCQPLVTVPADPLPGGFVSQPELMKITD